MNRRGKTPGRLTVDTFVLLWHTCAMTAPALRERQASLARTTIFEALVAHLEAGDADDVPMEDLAREAGVSRRTLYRYFPTRAALLAEAAEWVRDEVLQLPVEIGDEGPGARGHAGHLALSSPSRRAGHA